MTAAARFKFHEWAHKDGGDDYFQLPLATLFGLDPFWRDCALEVGGAVMYFARELKDVSPTTAEIAALIGRSHSFVQKGFYALDNKLGILARVRKGGHRFLDLVKGLKPSRKAAGDPAVPPGPPFEERRDTTTGDRSSSFPENHPEKTGGTGETPSPELVARACKLIPEATPGWVGAVVGIYGSAWVSQALDEVEERNRKPGNTPVYRRSFVQKKLEGWASPEQGGPPKKAEPAPRRPAAKPATPEADPSDEAKEKRLREAWGLLSEPQREAIRAKVKAENPGLHRWPSLLEPLCLAELEKCQAAERPRAP